MIDEELIEVIRTYGKLKEEKEQKPVKEEKSLDNMSDYLKEGFLADIDKAKKEGKKNTGFKYLDEASGGIHTGLYVIGGISSVGKTTFIHQMADQLAEQGHHILYFSLEQSRFELASKSIARTLGKQDFNKAISSIEIRASDRVSEELIRAGAELYSRKIQNRMNIIEGNFNCTVSFISKYTEEYIKQYQSKPVIIVDYLQVLQADIDEETHRKPTDSKQITDNNITALKRLSRSLDVPVLVISSLNRSNYLAPIDFESFKESGAIEYTADVIWGLQLDELNSDRFTSAKELTEKRKLIAEAKDTNPRMIELVCLKNRYGRSRYNARFMYFPHFDYYHEIENQPKDNIKRISI